MEAVQEKQQHEAAAVVEDAADTQEQQQQQQLMESQLQGVQIVVMSAFVHTVLQQGAATPANACAHHHRHTKSLPLDIARASCRLQRC